MKNFNMKLIPTLAICAILMGCTEDVEPMIEEKDHSWIQHEDIIYGFKYLLNSRASEKDLQLVSKSDVLTIDVANQATNYTLQVDYQDMRVALSDDIIMRVNEDDDENGKLVFGYLPGIEKSGLDISVIGLNISDYDPAFRGFDYSRLRYSFGAYNNKYQVLIPYRGSSEFFSAILIAFQVEHDLRETSDFQHIRFSDVQLIQIPGESDVFSSSMVTYAIGDNFILSNAKFAAKVYSNGEVKMLTDFAYNPEFLFELNGEQYAVAQDGFYVSNDDGESWQLKYSSYLASNENYTVVDDRVIVYRGSFFAEMVFTADGFVTRSLVNEGLAGNSITSISEFNDKVYVTTLSGLFYKDLADVFVEQEEEE
ncbi:MAG: hypothetical protein AAFQ98_05955 [Bacteroidota bacterium]